MIGLAAAAVLALVTAAVLVAIRIFRPAEPRQIWPWPTAPDAAAMAAAMDAAAEPHDWGLGDRLVDLEDRFGEIASVCRQLAAKVDSVQIRAEEAERLAQQATNRNEALAETLRLHIEGFAQAVADLRARADQTDNAFSALDRREALVHHAHYIDLLAGSLTVTDEMENVDFKNWSQEFQGFRSHLSSWCEIARFFKSNVQEEVEKAPQEMFKRGYWSFKESLFSDSDEVHDYKHFRILFTNYQKQQPLVMINANNMIFGR